MRSIGRHVGFCMHKLVVMVLFRNDRDMGLKPASRCFESIYMCM